MTTDTRADAASEPAARDARRQPLSRDRIVCAAVDFVDSHCVADLSMRKLGAQLGVEAMSLYRYLPSKAALLDAVVDELVQDISVPSGDEVDWTDAVRAYARSFRQVAQAHPRVLPLLTSAGASHPGVRRVVDALRSQLRNAGFSDELAVHALCAIQGYTIGTTMWQIGGSVFRAPDDRRDTLAPDTAEKPDTPATASSAVIAPDPEFEFGLEVVLDGLRRKLDDEQPARGAGR